MSRATFRWVGARRRSTEISRLTQFLIEFSLARILVIGSGGRARDCLKLAQSARADEICVHQETLELAERTRKDGHAGPMRRRKKPRICRLLSLAQRRGPI
jgi:shikimate 5-dehydrogenase